MKPEQLHERFARTGYGYKLRNNIRFGDFKPEYIPNKVWETLLGDDVNNLRHMPHTLEITKQFQRYEKLGGELLRLTAITHDWGEAVVGDVALPDKIAQGQDLEEILAYNKIAQDVVPEEDLSLVPNVLWGDHELSEPFNVIEYIGYCQTGLRAGKMALLLAGGVLKLDMPRKEQEGLLGGLLALNKQVEVKNFPKLAKYADKYRSIEKIV